MPRKDPPARFAKRVTIKDVAAAAGVSPMTVSNVVNGKHQFVGERTRKAVEREIARLNYRVQHSAWSLRVARRRSVGMIVVDESPAFLSDHFTAHIVAGLTNILSHEDHTVSIQGIRGDRIDKAAIVRNFAVDGFCVIMSGTRRRAGGSSTASSASISRSSSFRSRSSPRRATSASSARTTPAAAG